MSSVNTAGIDGILAEIDKWQKGNAEKIRLFKEEKEKKKQENATSTETTLDSAISAAAHTDFPLTTTTPTDKDLITPTEAISSSSEHEVDDTPIVTRLSEVNND